MKNTSFFHSSLSTTSGRRSFLKQVAAWGGVATCAQADLQAAPLGSRQSSSPRRMAAPWASVGASCSWSRKTLWSPRTR